MTAEGLEQTKIIYPNRLRETRLRVPGDKSVAHRALMLAAICSGNTHVECMPSGADNRATGEILRQFGVEICFNKDGSCDIEGNPDAVRGRAESTLDCANSGTTMRLLSGLLSGRGVAAELIGDKSLSRRPMGRITVPLGEMGYAITAAGEGGRPPLTLTGGEHRPGDYTYRSPVASAQVKSCVLLAGLEATGDIVVTEPAPSRDHTERLLRYLGYRVESSGNYADPDGQSAYVRLFQSPPGFVPRARPIRVPGDISSAAFFLVAAALVGGARIVLEEVSINPTRVGILDLLETMGLSVQVVNRTVTQGNEPVADLHVGGETPGKLKAAQIGGELVPRLIDELPVISVLAAAAHGETVISDAAELRVKESDRIASTERLLKALGADVLSTEDGLRIKGPTEFKAFQFDAGDDHRLAMAASVAALAADGPCEIAGAQCAAVSYPEFYDHLSSMTGE